VGFSDAFEISVEARLLDIQKMLKGVNKIMLAQGKNAVAVYDGGFMAGKQWGQGGRDAVGAGTAFAWYDRDLGHKPLLFA